MNTQHSPPLKKKLQPINAFSFNRDHKCYYSWYTCLLLQWSDNILIIQDYMFIQFIENILFSYIAFPNSERCMYTAYEIANTIFTCKNKTLCLRLKFCIFNISKNMVNTLKKERVYINVKRDNCECQTYRSPFPI